MAKAFISYSRKDTEFTRRLADCLSEQKYELWVDWESIPPTVDWKSHIQKGVEEADTFLFLISPDSIKSKECGAELEEAVKNGKRLIPLLVREINADDAPKELKHINWIFFTKEEDFDKSFNKLLEAIETDYEWAQTHRRIQVKALEWERAGKENSFLLRGKDLEFAEGQLVVNASKEPKPTDLQREFILKSRKDAARLRRIRNGLLIGAAAVMFVLMLVALYQRGEAFKNEQIAKENEKAAQIAEAKAQYNAKIAETNEKEAKKNASIARIGELSALGVSKIGQDYNDALLMSVEAYRRAKDSGLNKESAEAALLSILQSRRGLLQVLLGHNDWVTGLDYSSDGKTLASSSLDGVTYLWDASDPQNPVQLKKLEGDGAKFSPTNSVLATSNESQGLIKLWDISNRANPFKIGEFPSTGSYSGDDIIGFSAKGNYIVSRNKDENYNNVIEIWDISNPQSPVRQYSIPGESKGLNQSGTILTVVALDEAGNKTLSLVDISNPLSPVLLSSIIANNIDSAAFSPDGNILAILNDDSGVTLWSVSNPYAPAQLSYLNGYSEGIYSLAFDPTGNSLVLGCGDGKVLLWDISDPQEPAIQPYQVLDAHSLPVGHVVYDRGGNILVSGGRDGMLMLWGVTKLRNPLEVQPTDGYAISSSPDGKFIATTNYDPTSNAGTTIIWDVTNANRPVQTSQLDTDAYFAGFSPNSKLLVTGSTVTNGDQQEDVVQLWDLSDPQKPVSHQMLKGVLQQAIFSPKSAVLITSSDDPVTGDPVVTLWDLSNPESPSKFGLVKGSTGGILFSPDDRKLAIPSDEDGKVGVWDISEPGKFNQVGSLAGSTVAFSPDGGMMAAGTKDPDGKLIVELWDVNDWTSRKKLNTLDGAEPVFSPNSKLLVTKVSDEANADAYNMMLWDISDPSKPTSNTLTGHFKPITSIAFSPDSNLFASASQDKTIILWNVSKPDAPQKGMTLTGHSDWINVAAFNSDGTELASGGWDKNVILWRVNSFKDIVQIASLKGSTSNIDSLAFAGDQRLISNGQILWNLDPAAWVEKACHLVGSNFSADKWSQLFSDEPYRDTCENFSMVPAPEPQPAAAPESAAPTVLPACTDAQETLACPLVQVSEPTFLNRFCVADVPYTLYAVPVGTTLTPLDDRYKCTDQGVHGGKQQYSCYGPPGFVFPANMCSTSCAIPQSGQCEAGFGLDSTQSCCVPIPSNVDADGCVQVDLEIKSCTAQ